MVAAQTVPQFKPTQPQGAAPNAREFVLLGSNMQQAYEELVLHVRNYYVSKALTALAINGVTPQTSVQKAYTLGNGDWYVVGVPYVRPNVPGPGIFDVIANTSGDSIGDAWIDIGSDYSTQKPNGEFMMLRKAHNGAGAINVKGLGAGVGRDLILQDKSFGGVGANGGSAGVGVGAAPQTNVGLDCTAGAGYTFGAYGTATPLYLWGGPGTWPALGFNLYKNPDGTNRSGRGTSNSYVGYITQNPATGITYFGNSSTTTATPDIAASGLQNWLMVNPDMSTQFGGRMGLGGAPATSAALDVQSTTGAIIVPRMTTAQKNALTAVDGMIVYDTTLAAFYKRQAGAWVAF